MAPKSSLLSHQPSKQEEEREESSSEDESDSQSCKEDKEENSSDDETEEGSSDDEEEIQGTLNNSQSQIPAPKFESKLISRRNGSDSDPDSEGSPSDYMLQPIRKGSVSSSKRSREESSEIPDSLRSCKSSRIEEKKSASTPGGGGGVGCINRLWSNEDEIAVLNGMIEFKTMKGFVPNADMGRFHSFIKGKLKVDFSKDQLRTKIIRMKKRFVNALKKGDNGSDPVFSKPHEVMAFEISKKIWGGAVDGGVGGSNENVKKEIQKVEKDVVDEGKTVEKEKVGEGGGFWSKYPYLNASFDNTKGAFPSLMAPVAGMSLLEERLSLIGSVKAKELDDKWKQLSVEETELSYKILMLMKEQVQLALDQ